ncbi:MAG: ABC transporter permease [Deinococcota bacterium]
MASVSAQTAAQQPVSPRKRAIHWGNLPWPSILVLISLVMVAIFAPLISPHNPREQDILLQFARPFWRITGTAGFPPEAGYWLGTDDLGRDILSNIIYGLRISLLVGFVAVTISLVIGTPVGLIAGFRRGRTDDIIMRLVDIQLALPTILIALGVLAVWGSGLWKVILVIGIVGWANYARLVRGSVLIEREKDYVTSAQALGTAVPRTLFVHILPNVLNALLVQISVDVPRVILLEATLSFLGLGVSITTPSLGLMVARGYERLFSGVWWTSVLPGVGLMILVLSINLLGDWLRDTLDPRKLNA